MLLDIIKQIVAKSGEQILFDSKKVNAFFLDLAKDEPKPLKRAFIECLEHGIVKVLKGAAKEEHANCKETIAQRLHTEEGLDVELYRQAIDILCEVLFGCVPSLPLSPPPQAPIPRSQPIPTSALADVVDAREQEIALLKQEVALLKQRSQQTVFAEPEMVFVQGGTFMMGATKEQLNDCFDNEKPAHYVTLSDYYIGKYPVTQRLWKRVMVGTPIADPSKFNGDDLPVESVSWNDIVNEFLPRLNAMTGKTYRLPTEAEWEYAARGGAKSRGYKYSGSNIIDDVAWYNGNSERKTHVVGTKLPNELGIYDMSGNVLEWVNDWYGSYNSGAQTNPKGSSSGSDRVFRSGSWSSNAGDCRVSDRGFSDPGRSYYAVGFRLVSLSP